VSRSSNFTAIHNDSLQTSSVGNVDGFLFCLTVISCWHPIPTFYDLKRWKDVIEQGNAFLCITAHETLGAEWQGSRENNYNYKDMDLMLTKQDKI